MNKRDFLDCFKDFTEEAVKDMILPVSEQSGDKNNAGRAAEVHLMRLPDSKAAKKKAPYILHQLITGADKQLSGHDPEATAVVRSVFCVYNDNEEEGALSLVELMERLRIAMLKEIVISKRYMLDINEAKLETLIYPEDTYPYYAGEMISTWKLPPVEREVSEWL